MQSSAYGPIVPVGSAQPAYSDEAGYPGIECDNWYVVLLPSGSPKDIIALLNREIAKTIAVPEVKERLATLGYEPVANTPDECAAQIRADIAKWSNVIRAAGIRAKLLIDRRATRVM